MHKLSIAGSTNGVAALIRRRINAIRTLATLSSLVAVLGVGAAVLFSTSLPHDRGMLAILGGTFAVTPYLLGRALEDAVNDQR